MSKEKSHWRRVKTLFDAALQQPPEQRGQFLRKACEADPEMLAELESLLDSHERAGQALDTASVQNQLGSQSFDRFLVGEELGPYRILRRIGQGGMGLVYLAERSDGAFQKTVAIKVMQPGTTLDATLLRFENERQILARLDHPHIARILDGGTTTSQLPYLVMEHVEGEPIDLYCKNRNLSVTDRLSLFLRICAAVSYAHRHLVIHRDLKPANILVTADGSPKLLDFGIAKLLDHGMSGLTLEGGFPLTPEYASPEQVRGEAVTTGTDIYSLGVLLFELLTGHRPYRISSRSRAEMERVVCEMEPPRPSMAASRAEASSGPADSPAGREARRLRRRLQGDLDNIILTALHKDSGRRYASVEALAQDIRRHQEGLPVSARPDTLAYRAGKFVSRHTAGVAAALLVSLTLLGGLGATLWQYRIAQEERDRAESRFQDLRRLAGSLLNEIHDAVRTLPGSTPTRELLLRNALTYLDTLAQESADDLDLKQELAAAYRKFGEVQGNPTGSNLGQFEQARASYQKSQALLEEVLTARPGNQSARHLLAVTHEKIGDLLSWNGQLSAAVEKLRHSLSIFQALAREQPGNASAQTALAISHIKLADILGNPHFPNVGEEEASLHHYRLSHDALAPLFSADPENARIHRYFGLIFERIGTMHFQRSSWSECQAAYERAFELRKSFAQRFPDNSDAQRDLAVAHEKLAEVLLQLDQVKAALAELRLSLTLFQRLTDVDPSDEMARRSVAVSYMKLGDFLSDPRVGSVEEAHRCYEESHRILQELAGSSVQSLRHLAAVQGRRAKILALQGSSVQAQAEYRKAQELLHRLLDSDPGNLLVRRQLAELENQLRFSAGR